MHPAKPKYSFLSRFTSFTKKKKKIKHRKNEINTAFRVHPKNPSRLTDSFSRARARTVRFEGGEGGCCTRATREDNRDDTVAETKLQSFANFRL